VQAAGLGNVPVSGDELKLTSPPGVLTGVGSVSVTVAVHVVAVPVAGDAGEHATAVVVPSVAAAADVGAASTPINSASRPNRRRRITGAYSGIRSW
jgi:acyl-CoA hydrolase